MPPSQAVCPQCRTATPAGARFCPSCGAPAGETAFPSPRARRLQEALGDGFAVDRLLGSGGFAEVYLAVDLQLKREVAVKTLHPELITSNALIERFLREAQAVARLRHPHIIPIYQVGRREDVAFFVMPLVEGESLRALLERDGPPPLDVAKRILRETADALGAAHAAGLVHRDIKPDNIMLDGADRRVVVTDFGIAKAVDGTDVPLTATGLIIGTPDYMSPEQAAGAKDLGPASDQYSLGVVGYQLVTGSLPFTGPSPQMIIAGHIADDPVPVRKVRRDVPVHVATAIERAMAKDPADRWPSCAAFVEALESTHVTVAARLSRRPRSARSGDRPAKGSRVRHAIGWAIAVAAVGVMATIALRATRAKVDPSLSVVAVLPFAPGTPDSALTALGRELVTTIGATLDGVGEIRTVDRYAVLKATSAGPLGFEQAAALARRLAAGTFVQGTVSRDGQNVRLDVGLYRAGTNDPLGTNIVVRAPLDSLSIMSDSVAWAVLARLWRSGKPPSPSLASLTTRSLPALKEYLDGERLVSEDRGGDAAAAFQRAAGADSSFWLAAWRYNWARSWMDEDADTAFARRYEAHLEAFAPRDRLIIEAEKASATESYAAHLARVRLVTERFPDDWPAWFFYADHLLHGGPLTGHSRDEARAALERTVQLNPDLTPAWQHLVLASLGLDSAVAGRAVRTWARLSGAGARGEDWSSDLGPAELVLRAEANGGHLPESLLDSVARAVTDSGGPGRPLLGAALTVFGFPGAAIAVSRRLLRAAPAGPYAATDRHLIALAWLARGGWDSALVAFDDYARGAPERASAVQTYALATLGAWLGVLPTTAAAERRAEAVRHVSAVAPGPDAEAHRAELAWADGLLAVAKRDGAALDVARATLRHTSAVRTAFLERSLAAVALTLRGPPRAAAESLAAIDDRARSDELGAPSRDPLAVSVNHLAGASALLAVGDTDRAMRTLVWHEAISYPGGDLTGALFAGAAYFRLAQLERAVEHYVQFLHRYDLTLPSQHDWIDQARHALKRLGSESAWRSNH
jgi:tRNA A-37 threonylcarbamoyl transferase component Bud32/tetratricopeptide (TPR) repeat protein/TolB-like protein